MPATVVLSAPKWASAAISKQVVRCLAATCGGDGLDRHLADCSVVLDGGKTILAHRALLAQSPFFRKLLKAQERKGESLPSIALSGFSPVVVAKMIKFLYTGEVSLIEGSATLPEFLELARQLHLNPAVYKHPKPGPRSFSMPGNIDLQDEDEVIASATNSSYGDTDENLEAEASQPSSPATSEEAQQSTNEHWDEQMLHDVSGESDDFAILEEMEKNIKEQSAREREAHSPAAISTTASAALSSLPSTSSASNLNSSQKRVSKLATKPAAIMPSIRDELEAKRLRTQEKLAGGFNETSHRPKHKIERYNSRDLFREESDDEPEPSSSMAVSSASSSSAKVPRRRYTEAGTTSASKRRKKDRRRAGEGSSRKTSSEESDCSSDSHDDQEEVVPLSSCSSRREGSAPRTPIGRKKQVEFSLQLQAPPMIELAQYRIKLLEGDNSSKDEGDTSNRISNAAAKKRKATVAPVNDHDDGEEEPIPAKSQKTDFPAEAKAKPFADLFSSGQHSYGPSSERELPNPQALEELKKKSFKKKPAETFP